MLYKSQKIADLILFTVYLSNQEKVYNIKKQDPNETRHRIKKNIISFQKFYQLSYNISAPQKLSKKSIKYSENKKN
jgi:hypothetical protein